MAKDIGVDALIDRIRLTEVASPGTPASGFGYLYIKTDGLYFKGDNGTEIGPLSSGGGSNNSWVAGTGAWSYTSADSPTFVASIPDADATEMGVGDRLNLTQTTVKYFIVTAKGSPSGGFTPVTIYGGTDYTLANAAITLPYYSHAKSPLGFPVDPSKWTISSTNGTIQALTGTQSVWYNSISLSVPIGIWAVSYEAIFQIAKSNAAQDAKCTLSTANNSESDNNNTTYHYISGTVTGNMATYKKELTLNTASKTTYYLNHLTTQASLTVFQTRGDISPTKIVAICAYL